MAQQQAAKRDGTSRRRSDSYPADRFDEVTSSGRVGAHRVHARPRFVWQYVVATALATALLTTVGILALTTLNSQGKLPGESPITTGPRPTQVVAELDPDATVALLDGSTPDGDVAMRLDPIITENTWGQIVSAGPAASSDIEISAVFYADPAKEQAALGLAEKLGGLSAYPSADYAEYGADLVVLIGSDYAGPGAHDSAAG